MELANNRLLPESLTASIIHECSLPLRGGVAGLRGFSQFLPLSVAGQRAEGFCWLVREEGRRVHFAAVTVIIAPYLAS